jgi:hypothetical protein
MNIEQMKIDAARYQRLRILGCAPAETDLLSAGTVIRFQGLDSYLDEDIRIHQSRGEFRDQADT